MVKAFLSSPRIEEGSRVERRRILLRQDLLSIALAAAILAALVSLGETNNVLAVPRLLLALIFVLYVPGYLLTSALFPSRDDLDGIERLGLSLVLSVAVIPLVALVLGHLPWGLRPWPILIGEYGATAVFAGAAILRQAIMPEKDRYTAKLVDWHLTARWQSTSPETKRTLLVIGGTLVLVAAIAAWAFAIPPTDQYTTAFYVLGGSGRAEGYPNIVEQNARVNVDAGIVNDEREQHNYRIQVWVLDSWDQNRRALAAESSSVTLPPGRKVEIPLTWHMPWVGQDQEVDLLLLVDGHAEPYRRLRLWLNVLAPRP